MSPPKSAKKWKPKFPGAASDGEEDPYVTAQRFVNVYRQLHVLREDLVTRYNDMLLEIDPDARATLVDIPGGRDVREYLTYLEQQKYGDDYVPEDDEDAFVSREEKAKARAIANALSSAQEKMNMNQMEVMRQAQEDARRNMEVLAKALAEAKQDSSKSAEVAELTQAYQAAQQNYMAYSAPQMDQMSAEAENVQSKLRAQYAAQGQALAPAMPAMPANYGINGGLETLSQAGSQGLDALVHALTEAQVKTAELQAKTQSETMAKIFSQSQEMTARAMAEAFSKSQQNAAEVQGNLIAKAIADSQRNATFSSSRS